MLSRKSMSFTMDEVRNNLFFILFGLGGNVHGNEIELHCFCGYSNTKERHFTQQKLFTECKIWSPQLSHKNTLWENKQYE